MCTQAPAAGMSRPEYGQAGSPVAKVVVPAARSRTTSAPMVVSPVTLCATSAVAAAAGARGGRGGVKSGEREARSQTMAWPGSTDGGAAPAHGMDAPWRKAAARACSMTQGRAPLLRKSTPHPPPAPAPPAHQPACRCTAAPPGSRTLCSPGPPSTAGELGGQGEAGGAGHEGRAVGGGCMGRGRGAAATPRAHQRATHTHASARPPPPATRPLPHTRQHARGPSFPPSLASHHHRRRRPHPTLVTADLAVS